MTTFTAEPMSVAPAADISTDVARVVEATRHLCDFRSGLAEIIVRLATDATQFLYADGLDLIEPALRILGTERATRMGARLYRIASDVTCDWYEGMPDRGEAERTLRVVAEQAAHEVADAFHTCSRACCNATRRIDPVGGIQL